MLRSRQETRERPTLRVTAGALTVSALAVALAAVFLATYLCLAAGSLGFGSLTVGGVFVLVTAGTMALWLTLAARSGPDDDPGRRTARLAQQALPFLAFIPAGVLAVEFVFGRPGPGRIVMAVGACLVVFAVLRGQIAGQLDRLTSWIERHGDALTFAIVGVHALVTIALVVIRHRYYNAILGEDTGYYNQIFWSTLHGDFFRGSLTQARYTDPPIHSEFSAHSSPVLFLLVPAYWIHPSFYTLLALRNVALSASALPIYFLAKARMGGLVALCLALWHLASPNLLYQSVSAFYPLQFAVLVLPMVFLFFERARFPLFVAALLLALWVREEIALTVVVFTLFALLLRRSWKWVLTPAVLSVIWWYISIHLIMVPSKIKMEDLETFYQAFPDGYASAPGVLLNRPIEFLGLIFNADNASYLYQLIKSSAGMALATPAIIFALPTTLINLIVGAFWKTTTSLSMHYSLVASVCLSIALVYAIPQLARLHHRFRASERAFAFSLVLVLTPVVVLGVKDVVAYGGSQDQTLLADLMPRPYQATLDRIVRIIEEEPRAAVAAPNILLPHVSKRRDLYNTSRLWWYGTPELDYIVVDSDIERFDQGDRHRARYQDLIAGIDADAANRLILDEHGFRVYRVARGLSPVAGDHETVRDDTPDGRNSLTP